MPATGVKQSDNTHRRFIAACMDLLLFYWLVYLHYLSLERPPAPHPLPSAHLALIDTQPRYLREI